MTAQVPNPEETTLLAADGTSLYLRLWRVDQPRAVLVNIHGLGDHGGLYSDLVDMALSRGWSVYGPDTRGNGRSGGPRGHVAHFEVFRSDLHTVVTHVRQTGPAVPLILIGHSLGGLIALDYALAHPQELAALVLAAPPLGTLSAPRHLLQLARMVSGVWPSFTLETGIDLSTLADDPAILPALLADPLFHRKASVRLATEVERTIADVTSKATQLSTPTLILHGSGDAIVPIEGSRQFAHAAGNAPLQLVELPAARHALFADWGNEERLALMGYWIEQQCQRARVPKDQRRETADG